MSVVIYEMRHSPFCIPITQMLRAGGVEFDSREIPNWDRSEVIRLTKGAYYQVPLLLHDERAIFESQPDSQDVARYVDKTFLRSRLFPAPLEGLQAILIDFLENEVEARTFKLVDPPYLESVDDIVARAMVVRHKERKFGPGCIDQWRRDAPKIRAEADRLLQRFEVTLQHSPFLLGKSPVYSDFLLFGILGNLTFRGYNRLNESQQALGEWSERLRALRWSD